MGKKLKCLKCNDIIQSKSVHDWVECKCGAIYIDGGDDYLHYGGDMGAMEWVEEEDDFPDKGYEKYSRISTYF